MNISNLPLGKVCAATLLALGLTATADAANHREAPITALDNKADITDYFSFVSYDDPSKVTFIMNVDPLLEPGNGPNYFPFDPAIRYAISIDNDFDAEADIMFEFDFETEIRAPGVFQAYVGAGEGVPAPANSPAPVEPGTPIIPPAITSLDGEGSAGLSLRQTYTVTRVDRSDRGFIEREEIASGLIAVPTNAGPRTMPNYEDLYEEGINEIPSGIRVFAGTVEDPFWIDLGAAFDTLNFRASAFATGVPGVLSDEQDANDDVNFAPDEVSGYNVNSIAIEIPISQLTADGSVPSADEPEATIGSWGSTHRPRLVIRSQNPERGILTSSRIFTQIQRMGNPLINELIIGTGSKDLFSRSLPRDDAQFADFFLDPLLARVLNAFYEATVGEGTLPIPEPPRTDLLPLVTYAPPIAAPGTPAGPVADLLRLNTGVAPASEENRSRLGVLGGDLAGFPNGRRVSDDVTDIAARAVVGVLAGGEFAGFPHNRIGDGVNTNDAEYRETFPYVAPAHSGRNSRHIDPSEMGCDGGTCPVD